MAVTSGFFNSLNGDRKYSAEQFSALFDNLITDGVFANVGTAFEVKATPENTITIGIGRAWFNSVWLYNDTLYPMVPQEPEVLLNRIDAIAIEINHNEAVRSGQIRWVYGTPSSEPVRPTLTNTDEVHQYPLAYVYRHAGVSDVIQADITNMIGTSACPYVTGILSTQSIDKVVAQWESQFNVWFDGLETTLDGDVAANLANQVLELQSRFHDLAKDRAVYEALQDSTGATIKDSDSGDILARTVLGGENVIINYPTGGAGEDIDPLDGFKAGDIFNTARTDLGPDWILANGSAIDKNEYPQLAPLIPVKPSDGFTQGSVQSVNSMGTCKMIFGNGKWVRFYCDYASGDLCADYADSLDGPWTKKVIEDNPSVCYPFAAVYGDGYYVVAYSYKANTFSKNTIYVSYTNDLSGSWSSRLIDSSGDDMPNHLYTRPTSLTYENGYFCLGYMCYVQSEDKTYMGLSISTPSSIGTWTKQHLRSASGKRRMSVNRVRYLNNQYVLVGTSYEEPDTNDEFQAIVGYSSNITGGWVYRGLWTSDVGFNEAFDIAYVNGKYIIIGIDSDGNGIMCYTDSDTFNSKVKKTFWPKGISKAYLRNIIVNDHFIVLNGIRDGNFVLNYLPVSMDLEATWSEKILRSGTSWDDEVDTFDLLFEDNTYVTVGQSANPTLYYYTASDNIQLPSISISDGIYSYIKVRD